MEDLDIVEFGLHVPEVAVIVGILVRPKAGRTSANRTLQVQLMRNGTPVGSAKAWTPSPMTACEDTQTVALGGSEDLWGATWTPVDVNAQHFGVRISSGTGPGTRVVDAVEIRVFYELPTESCKVELLGSLSFSLHDSTRVQDPSFRGSVLTEHVQFVVTTSMEACTFTIRYTPFQGTLGVLPTTLNYSFGPVHNAELRDPPGVVTLQAPRGETSGSLFLTVLRDGHRDPAVLYWATVTVMCMNL